MERIKRFGCAIAVLALLMTQANPALAKFAGTLRTDTPWLLQVHGGPGAAITVTFVDSKGRQEIELFTAPSNGDEDFYHYFQERMPRGTRRLIIDVDFAGASFQSYLRIQQGTTLITVESCSGADCVSGTSRFVFDVLPGAV